MKTRLSILAMAMLLAGCAGSNESASFIKTAIGAQPGILYVKGKMKNPMPAEVIKVKGEEIALTNQAIVVFGASGVVGAELQKEYPETYPSNSPGQIVWVKFANSQEANATYRLDMKDPYTFRVKDAVTVDMNNSAIVGIRAAFDNPHNLDINSSGSAK